MPPTVDGPAFHNRSASRTAADGIAAERDPVHAPG